MQISEYENIATAELPSEDSTEVLKVSTASLFD